MLRRSTLPFALLLGLAAALAGCSSTRLVDGQVQSFSTLAAMPAPATYRIERLPSQQTPAFDTLAALAEQSLARAGLQRDDAAPRLLVQIGIQADSVPRYDSLRGPGFYGFYGPPPWAWRDGWGLHGFWRMAEPTPLYRRAVSLVLRDATTQAIVYETSAVHEDTWVSDPAVYGVLFDAALNGFPQPPGGARQVRLPLTPTTP
ncbi:DUF4136 domain-containing protein [Verminephrobacter eiseniae]|uniref:DUF4136 domain-containing protein n=1 Tax=Verminephrobacter eiseniae (strain EF01-2) TaxID=391735 RepID=A1WHW5_VEREI|nr:DUF4136 domain-containing protein [Verminephrobacter eiseniae]ABM57222.1 conserved hypothetical protein [Verminephrobacter eiseniae EF01-2]MCW5262408.1 DUF4136 domain-containing protein [Verminephrobacter eiseniae]MCW5282851.1 DUF4136 domain-containing protein [Verminephrobacter eiseniae]MCW5303167.1 DUF4136 domain-containing protein [Verminephrobacter eiseniae]MCW8179895.1 DUF4136 domain-containing protein [Verminephrobacter eiseniae]